MTDFKYVECLDETLQELRQDAHLLNLALLGAQTSADGLTLDCLLRLTDYLRQHVILISNKNDTFLLEPPRKARRRVSYRIQRA